VATFVVAVSPVLVVWALSATGVVRSTMLLVLLGTVLSVGLASAGRAYWERRPGSEDLLFGDLMIWGWLRRSRIERRLSRAMTLLELGAQAQSPHADQLTPEQQARLLEDLANALEARDPYTHGHSRRVARHTAMIAKKMGLPRTEVSKVRAAAAVHDVGKIDTPSEILNKPDRLTDEEFAVVKLHPARGEEMVSVLGDEELARIVRHHHERLDGAGYPDRLSGDDIPLGARIIAVADTFDAITSDRPYRSVRPHKQALDILSKEAGTQLDPDAVRAFSSYYSGFRPLALWVVLTHLPQRLFYPLVREVSAAAGGAASAAKVVAATAATAAVGSAVVSSEVAAQRSEPARSAVSAAGTAVAFSKPGEADQLGFLGNPSVATDSPPSSHSASGRDAGAGDNRDASGPADPSADGESGSVGLPPAPAPTDSQSSVVGQQLAPAVEPSVTPGDGQELGPVGAPSVAPDDGSSSGQASPQNGSQGNDTGGGQADDPSGSSNPDDGGGTSSGPGGSSSGPGGSSSGPRGGSNSGRGHGPGSGPGAPDSRGGGGSSGGQGSSPDGGPAGGPSPGPGGGGSQGGGPSSGRGAGSGSGGGGSSSDPGGSGGGSGPSADPGSSVDPGRGGSQGPGLSPGLGGGSNSGAGGGPSSDSGGSISEPGAPSSDPGGPSSGGGRPSGGPSGGPGGSSGSGGRPEVRRSETG
jgi:hypothetical protein